jgi:outer membrane receptor for ferrienterochelin and colicins
MKYLYLSLLLILLNPSFSQETGIIHGTIQSLDKPIEKAKIELIGTPYKTTSDAEGNYVLTNIPKGKYTLQVTAEEYQTKKQTLFIDDKDSVKINIYLTNESNLLDEVVVSGTMKAVRRLENPVPVEILTTKFLKQNPTSNIFDALQNVNGVRPQNNCNVCNTGDIRINGLDGPYTMVTIDGMPIVSALGSVYGLSGIPNALIDRIEIVKGAASSLYGSEAVGGLINIITKNAKNSPKLTVDAFTTSWAETNVDLGYKVNFNKNADLLLGVNYFNYNYKKDENQDNFTDISLQNRVSLFSKFNFNRKSKKELSLVARYLYEDRWGGEMQWNSNYRAGDVIYAESIYTSRYEFLGKYQLPVKEKMYFQFSFIGHNQNSAYGNSLFIANQKIGFGQLLWDKNIKNHSLLFGAATRLNFYDDNTPTTLSPSNTSIYSAFVQDEMKISDKTGILVGARYDYNESHGSIFTPRMALKWKPTHNDIVRLNLGTGFRIVNLFTEDHQSLSGARTTVITEKLNPETSYNVSLNYLKKINFEDYGVLNLEFTNWYTYFSNKIIADYDTNPNQIIYSNLDGYSRIIGASTNIDWISPFGLKSSLGMSFLNPITKQDSRKSIPLFTEKFTATAALSYEIPRWFLSIDYTANLTGSMRLPLLSPTDPRREYSLPYSIQNIQFTYKKIHSMEIYLGIKNILNWTPAKSNPFLIARADDPFDKNVVFDSNGNVIPTNENPYGLTFDPTYAYGTNQGIRFFLGTRFHLD